MVILWFILFFSTPFSGTELLKPSWNFLSDGCKSVFVMLMRWLQEPNKDGGWLPGAQTVITGLELSVPLPWSPRDRNWRLNRLPMTNDLINHVYEMKPPQKSKGQDSESSWVGEHTWSAEREVPLVRAWKPCAFPPYLCPCISYMWLYLSSILL